MMTTWKQSYDSGELANTWQLDPTVRDLSGLPPMAFFYTRREAARAAQLIGWPKNSARSVSLPFGHLRWVISDDHNNALTKNGYDRLLQERGN